MDVNTMTFGVEIECLLPAGRVAVGGYHRGIELVSLHARGHQQAAVLFAQLGDFALDHASH